MSDYHGVNTAERGPTPRGSWDVAVMAVTFVVIAAMIAVVAWVGLSTHPTASLTTATATNTTYPVGVVEPTEVSGLAPPMHVTLHGFRLVDVTVFTGNKLPSSWQTFKGQPGGLPGGQFAPSHVVVGHGVLNLITAPDPKYGGRWVTGGVCQCGRSATYGAYFIRSRVTGLGPNEVELLWPASGKWPPEIDFSETGASVQGVSATVHYGRENDIIQLTYSTNMRHWHTWGVIWTPSAITYVVDGHPWGEVTQRSAIPSVPMRLDLEQRYVCGPGSHCANHSISMLVNWVMEYRYIPR